MDGPIVVMAVMQVLSLLARRQELAPLGQPGTEFEDIIGAIGQGVGR